MTKRNIYAVPAFNDRGTGNVKILQEALKEAGFLKGSADDYFGPKTLAALQAFQKSYGMVGTGVIPADGGKTFKALYLTLQAPQEEIETTPSSADYFGAPWIGANIDLLGRHETDPVLQARYVPEWKLEGLPGYKTLAGNRYAWCSVKVNADFRKVGIKGTNSAGAASWSKWGRPCPYVFGAVLDIKHKGGGRHVAFFLYWIDEAKRIAAVYGGNQGNKLSIVSNNLSGSFDTLVSGPRWPEGRPHTRQVSKAEVLKAYPHLKVGGVGGSTR